jgi:LysM repeat protein
MMKGKVLAIAIYLGVLVAAGVGCGADVEIEKVEYVVQAGDTLWSIAEEYAPEEMYTLEYIQNIKKNNGLKSSDVYENMVLKIEREVK